MKNRKAKTDTIYLVARVLELPNCPSLPFRVIMSMQDVGGRDFAEYKVIIILLQVMLFLLTTALFAKVQLLLPKFFCEGTMRTPSSEALTLKRKKRVFTLFSC